MCAVSLGWVQRYLLRASSCSVKAPSEVSLPIAGNGACRAASLLVLICVPNTHPISRFQGHSSVKQKLQLLMCIKYLQGNC